MSEHMSSKQRRNPAVALAARAAAAAALISGVGASTAHATDYYVDPSGANGAFPTIQAAVTAVAGQTATNRANIYIAPGVYTEAATLGVSVTKPYVSFIGQGNSPADVKISLNNVPNVPPTTFGATVTIGTAGTRFMANNLTFENSQPDLNRTQALAMRCQADQSIFNNCRFLGYQDTLLADRKSRQYYRNCFITGDVDFMYGDATAVFDRAVIESTDGGYITAVETKKDTANGFVIMDSTLVPGSDRNPQPDGLDDGTTTVGRTNVVYLGRPWHWDDPAIKPSATYIRTKMGPHIRTAGWWPWDPVANTDPDATSRYSEYGSMDLNGNPLPLDADGLPSGRVKWADTMTAEQAANYTLANIFGGASTIGLWNTPGAQPEGTGVTYVDARAAWDALGQLPLLPAAVSAWDLDADGTWSTWTNWTNGRPNGRGVVANFGEKISGPRTITVDAPQTVGVLNFDNVNSYTIIGAGSGSLSMGTKAGQAAINVNRGSHTISAPLTLLDPTTLTISAVSSTLTLTALEPSTVTLTKSGPGTLAVRSVDLDSLNITGGRVVVQPRSVTGTNTVMRLNTLSIGSSEALDLNDNDLVVNGGNFIQIQAWVIDGFGATTGITSSASDGSQILALFDNALAGAGEWDGHTLSPTAVVGKYTYFGDANLDGQVTGDDYAVVDSNLDTDPPVGIEWLSGDANLDGIVTGDDYATIDSNLGLGAGNPLSHSARLSAVPEPAAGVVAVAALLLGRQRRKTNNAPVPL